VENPKWQRISDETKAAIARMLLEKIPLAGIARSLQLSKRWLQQYVNDGYTTMPQQVQVQPKTAQRLNVQMDELWSFVDDKGNEQWVWLALDVRNGEIVGYDIGDRLGQSAQALWELLPTVYRQCAVCYTDFWVSYRVAFPSKRHQAVTKKSGKTSYIERFNHTVRQRVARLVRKTLSFSKKLDNHSSAIWNFIHHHTEQRRHILTAQNQRISSNLS
jgi:IS1 family transposase